MLTCLFVIFALLLVKFTIFLLPYVVIVSCNGLCDSWGKKVSVTKPINGCEADYI